MLTSVRILSHRLPGVHLSAQVEGGKRSEVLPKVQALLEQLEKWGGLRISVGFSRQWGLVIK